MVIDTPNCANKAAGMANIRIASNNKRMVRILITLPDHPSTARLCLAAAGCVDLNGDWIRRKDSMHAIPSLCTNAHFSWTSQLNLVNRFSRNQLADSVE